MAYREDDVQGGSPRSKWDWILQNLKGFRRWLFGGTLNPETRIRETSLSAAETRGEEDLIRFYTKRTKPLSQLTAADVPRGLDPEDVATDFVEDQD